MNTYFEVQILTPASTLFRGKATEVVLPAFDGEVGVLAGHGDFVGLLGTGSLKIVTEGNDHWYILSSGTYRVSSGVLTVLAEKGEEPEKNVDLPTLTARLNELEKILGDFKSFTPEEFPQLKLEYDQTKARIEVYRRTQLVN